MSTGKRGVPSLLAATFSIIRRVSKLPKQIRRDRGVREGEGQGGQRGKGKEKTLALTVREDAYQVLNHHTQVSFSVEISVHARLPFLIHHLAKHDMFAV